MKHLAALGVSVDAEQTVKQTRTGGPDATATAPANASASDADNPLRGLSLAGASMTIGTGRNLVTDYVLGADNKLAQIRVIDQTTHQVIAASPPDTIARMQQEILTYQRLAHNSNSQTPQNNATSSITPPENG